MLAEVRSIVREVAGRTGIPESDILSKDKKARIVAARWEVVRALRKTGRTQSQIARLLGQHHTTVRHALRHQVWPKRWHRPHIKKLKGALLRLYLTEAANLLEVAMIGHYRIYPSWFTGREGALADVTEPMAELAQCSARAMGLKVLDTLIIATGEDFRGPYIDFNVTYASSTERLQRAKE